MSLLTSSCLQIREWDLTGNRALGLKWLEDDGDSLVQTWLDMRKQSGQYLLHIEDRRQGKGGGIYLALNNTRGGSRVNVVLEEITMSKNKAITGGTFSVREGHT